MHTQKYKTEISLIRLLRSYWKQLVIAAIGVVGVSAADLLQPWPLKIVLDYVIANRRMPEWLNSLINLAFGHNSAAILNFAIVSVVIITLVDSISSYTQSYFMTSIGEWVGHDLRRTVYRHIERLSLKYHDQQQTGDLTNRSTVDIESILTVITSNLLDTVIHLLIVAGMLAVMVYLEWKFSLIALCI